MSCCGIDDMSVGAIMQRWPRTIRAFIDLDLRCVGCPIAAFHTLADAASEHGLAPQQLDAAITKVVAGSVPPRLKAGRERLRRR